MTPTTVRVLTLMGLVLGPAARGPWTTPPVTAQELVPITVKDHVDYIEQQADTIHAEQAKANDSDPSTNPDADEIRRAQRRARDTYDKLREWERTGRDATGPLTDEDRRRIVETLRRLADGNARLFGYTKQERIDLRMEIHREGPRTAKKAVEEQDRRFQAGHIDPLPSFDPTPGPSEKGDTPKHLRSAALPAGPSLDDLRGVIRGLDQATAGGNAVYVPTPVPPVCVMVPPAETPRVSIGNAPMPAGPHAAAAAVMVAPRAVEPMEPPAPARTAPPRMLQPAPLPTAPAMKVGVDTPPKAISPITGPVVLSGQPPRLTVVPEDGIVVAPRGTKPGAAGQSPQLTGPRHPVSGSTVTGDDVPIPLN